MKVIESEKANGYTCLYASGVDSPGCNTSDSAVPNIVSCTEILTLNFLIQKALTYDNLIKAGFDFRFYVIE